MQVPATIVALALGLFVTTGQALAYERTPSGDPAQSPILFDLTTNLAANCDPTYNWKLTIHGPNGYGDRISTQYTTGTSQILACGQDVWRADINGVGSLECPFVVGSIYLNCDNVPVGTLDGDHPNYSQVSELGFTIIASEEEPTPTSTEESATSTILAIENLHADIVAGFFIVVLVLGLILGLKVVRK